QTLAGLRVRKSSSSWLTASGRSSCIQCPAPSTRAYVHGPATYVADAIIGSSSRNRSPLDQSPSTGAVIGGSAGGGATSHAGGSEAPEIPSAAVSAARAASTG